jgi:hypothetical protein
MSGRSVADYYSTSIALIVTRSAGPEKARCRLLRLSARIGERMDMDELMTRMREGLSSGHRDMPMFRFSREDGRAIRSYLNTIQD